MLLHLGQRGDLACRGRLPPTLRSHARRYRTSAAALMLLLMLLLDNFRIAIEAGSADGRRCQSHANSPVGCACGSAASSSGLAALPTMCQLQRFCCQTKKANAKPTTTCKV